LECWMREEAESIFITWFYCLSLVNQLHMQIKITFRFKWERGHKRKQQKSSKRRCLHNIVIKVSGNTR
jgi:hypothetical protein